MRPTPTPLWQPSEAFIATTRMTVFTNWLRQKSGTAFPDYFALHQWSVTHLEEFWESFLEYSQIIYSQRHQQVLAVKEMPSAKWFTGMRLNFAENIFARNFNGVALAYRLERSANDTGPEHGCVGEYSFAELRRLVARCARGLRNAGLGEGDRVAGFTANVPEAVIASLACASLGATWCSASPDFGLEALCDRFIQVQPKLIFASTHYHYNGNIFRTDEVVKQLHHRLPSVQTVVSVSYPAGKANVLGDTTWQDFLGNDDTPALPFVQLPFDHPLYILFSSGTTGAPKCLVHGTGGTLLQHRKEQELHCNIRSGDALLYYTTCGWMMWNWLLSALSLGAKICLYDGSPAYPEPTTLWRVADELGVTHLGTSGRYIETCMKAQPPIQPGSLGALPALRAALYTGSPLSAQGFRWFYETVKKNIPLFGISGGTDIVSCFVLGNPNLPVYAGEMQCKSLGVDVVALDEKGVPVMNQPGELVCRQPLPSMPIGFLNDSDGKKYRSAYFEEYPGLWHHGDYVQFTANGGAIIFGRSDATLNPGGVRIGSAEIYSALDHLDFIVGAVAVGWQPPAQSDEVIVLLVVLAQPCILDEARQQEIRRIIREKCSPRHVPHHLFQISEIPVTRSGKTVELSVKAILAGKTASNRTALANPHVLDEIDNLRKQLMALYAQT